MIGLSNAPLVDLTGKHVSGKTIVGIVASNPQRKYRVTCNCGSEWVDTHSRIMTFINSGAFYPCKNESHKRGLPTNDTAREALLRDRQQERDGAEKQRDAELRKRYGAPEAAAPKADPEQSLREAESKFKETARQLALVERARIVNGQPDPGFVPDPAYDDARMTIADAAAFNESQSEIFKSRHPDYYQTPENAQALVDYCWSQGVRILSALTLERAYRRLQSFGLLESRPPVPEPELSMEPQPVSIEHELYESYRHQPQMIEGWDQSGDPIKLSVAEVDRMDAESYRAFQRIPRITRTDRGRQ